MCELNSFEKIIDDFLDDYGNKKQWSDHTQTAYKHDLLQFIKITDVTPETITQRTLTKYYHWLDSEFTSVATKNRKLIVVKVFLRYLNKNKMVLKKIVTNDTKLFEKGKQGAKKNAFTQTVYALLMEEVKKRDDWRTYALFMTLRDTGTRISEALSLTCGQTKNNVITIKGKGRKTRDIYISRELMSAWQKHLKRRQDYTDDSPLFDGEHGNAVSSQRVYALVKFYAKNLPVAYQAVCHPHSFRHLFITTMIREMGVEFASLLAGHANIQTTMGYNDITEDEILASTRAVLEQQHAQEKGLVKTHKKAERQAVRESERAKKKNKVGRPKGKKSRK